MPTTTWLNRLIDESNTWFLAVKSEDSSRFADAVIYYMKDAVECLKKDQQLQAALSCASAASCLEKTGDALQASRLYVEAASIYEENSVVTGKDLKERLWSLERAYYFSILANDIKHATDIHNRLLSLQDGNAKPVRGAVEQQVASVGSADRGQIVQANRVSESIDEFLELRKSRFQKPEVITFGKQGVS